MRQSFEAIVEDLVANYGLGDATHVMLTGSSAGGLGTFHNVDLLAERLPNAVVKGAPVAGWFFPQVSAHNLTHRFHVFKLRESWSLRFDFSSVVVVVDVVVDVVLT